MPVRFVMTPGRQALLDAAIADDGRLTCGRPSVFGPAAKFRAKRDDGGYVEISHASGRPLEQFGLIERVRREDGNGTEPALCNARGYPLSWRYRVTQAGRDAAKGLLPTPHILWPPDPVLVAMRTERGPLPDAVAAAWDGDV